MAQAPISREVAQQAVDALVKHGGVTAAADALGIPNGTLEGRLRTAKRRYGIAQPGKERDDGPDANAPAAPPISIEHELRDRVRELEGQLKASRDNTIDEEYVKRKIIGLSNDAAETKAPEWAVRMVRGEAAPGIPTAIASDWHWGERVFPAQVNGVNEYNIEIAHRRSRAFFEKIVLLLRHHVVNPNYPGIVLPLGGDMLTGDIHDELSETNEVPNMVALLDLFAILKWGIGMLADEFGYVFLPCVPGNHGRNTHKPRAKNRAFTNFDWLLYQFLARTFENDKRILFFIPDGPDALYEVAGHKYLLTHGDQFRGGDGMIGHFGPVLRGQKKKQSRNADIGLEFDTLVHGHFHTYFPTSKIIGNGSLKGLDEYAHQGNFGYEPPIQAMWLTHPEHGITIHLPIYLERAAGKIASPTADWVSWHKQ